MSLYPKILFGYEESNWFLLNDNIAYVTFSGLNFIGYKSCITFSFT